jgi:hypothetical protein
MLRFTMLCYRSSIIIIMHYADFFAGHSRGGSVTPLMIKAAITMVNWFMGGLDLIDGWIE